MTTVFVFTFGIPVVVWLWLALTPLGTSYWMTLGVFAIIWCLGALQAYTQSPSGPDDFYAGIEMIPLWGSLYAATSVTVAQLWSKRRTAGGKKSLLWVLLIAVTIAPYFLINLYFWGLT